MSDQETLPQCNIKQKVYVTNKGAHDYTDALRYGELSFCTDGLVAKYNTSQMVRVFNDAFKDSSPDDYILMTSLTTLCSIACAVFAAKHRRLNLLIFKDERYVLRHVVFD